MTAARTIPRTWAWPMPCACMRKGPTSSTWGRSLPGPVRRHWSRKRNCCASCPCCGSCGGRIPGAVLSVDTYHAATAAAVLEEGVQIINDISACAFDPGLLDVLVQYKPGYVLMHSQGRPDVMQQDPRYADVRSEVMAFFERGLHRLTAAGLPEEHIVLDPGIGFGKTLGHNLELLAHAEDWLAFGRPVLLGLSMKSMFGQLLGLTTPERGCATQVATALLWEKGLFWHRVHDVAATRRTLTLAAALRDPAGACRP